MSETATPSDVAAAPPSAPPPAGRVALVGDPDLERIRASAMLESQGHRVDAYPTPDRAYQGLAATRREVALLVVDLCQPVFDGLATIGWLRTKGLLGACAVWVIEDPFAPVADAVCQTLGIQRCVGRDTTPEALALVVNEQLGRGGSERRREPRVAVFALGMLGFGGKKTAGYLTDLSRGGAYVRTASPLQIGTAVTLTFPVPGTGTELKLKGTVVRASRREDRYRGVVLTPGMAIEWSDVGADERATLEAVLRSRSAARTPG